MIYNSWFLLLYARHRAMFHAGSLEMYSSFQKKENEEAFQSTLTCPIYPMEGAVA